MNKEIDISGIVLKTEKLILRPWKETDLLDFNEYSWASLLYKRAIPTGHDLTEK